MSSSWPLQCGTGLQKRISILCFPHGKLQDKWLWQYRVIENWGYLCPNPWWILFPHGYPQEKHQLITYKFTKQEEKADQYVSGDWESRSTQFICEMAENLTSQCVTREEFFVPIGETWVAQFFNDTTTSGPKCCMQLKQLELKMLPKTSPSFQWWISLYYSRT